MPDTEPRKLTSLFLSRLMQGSNGTPRSEAHSEGQATAAFRCRQGTADVGSQGASHASLRSRSSLHALASL